MATPAAAVTIDDFATAQAQLLVDQGGKAVGDTDSSTVTGAVIVGSERDLRLQLVAGIIGSTTTAEVTGGVLLFDAYSGATGELQVAWDGADGDADSLDTTTGLGGIDLTASGHSGFKLTVNQTSAAGGEVIFEVYSDSSNSSRVALLLPLVDTATDFILSYSDFVADLGSGATFSSVRAIRMVVRGSDRSVYVANLETVPPEFLPANVTKAALLLDGDGDSKADAGETISYTITINNTGASALNVNLDDLLDSNVSLTAGTLKTTPLAFRDSYSGCGNATLSVDDSAGKPGLLANDTDPDGNGGNPLTITSPVLATPTATARGGSVTVLNANSGTFTYVPAVGFSGVDWFPYTMQDDDANSVTGGAFIEVENTIWFVDNDTTGADLGTQADPFLTLAQAETASAPGDTIFIYEAATTTGLNAGITLQDDQFLIGQGVDLVACGVTLVSATSAPTIANAAGHVVRLGDNNTIRGLKMSPTASAGIYGSSFSDLTVASATITRANTSDGVVLSSPDGTISFTGVTIDGTVSGGLAVDIDSAAATADIDFVSCAVTPTGGALLDLTNSAGTCDFSGGSMTLASGTAATTAINLSTNTATLNLASLGSVATAGSGLAASSGGTLGLAAAATISSTGGPALVISSTSFATDPLVIAGITASGGATGINLSGIVQGLTVTGAVTVTATSGLLAANTGTLTMTNAGNAITATGGPVLDLNTVNLSMTLATASSSASAAEAIDLDSVTGSLVASGGTVASSSAAAAVDINGGSGTFTYGGTIAKSAGGRSVAVQNRTSGTTTFSGAINDDASGIYLNSNTGATIAFSGGLALDTGATTAFTATGGGTVNLTGSNTIGATTALSGGAVNISDTTIGASNVTFASIAVNGAGGNSTAIVLDDTGSGQFTVTGSGTTAGSGGTIENIDSDAITLNNSDGRVTFKNMIIEDIGSTAGGFHNRSHHDAIHGQTVDGGLTIDNTTIRRISDMAINGALFAGGVGATTFDGLAILNSTIQNCNRFNVAAVADSQDEGAVRIVGLSGTVTVDNSTVELAGELLDITTATSGTLNMTVTSSVFNHAYKEFSSGTTKSVGKMGIDVTVTGSANANVTIGDESNGSLGNQFLNCRSASIRVAHNALSDTGDIDAIIANNTLRVNDHSSAQNGNGDFPQGGILLRGRGTAAASLDAVVANNQFGVFVPPDDRAGSTTDEVGNADGGEGNLVLIFEGGANQVRVNNNQFNGSINAPWRVRADGNNSAAVLFTNNTYYGRDDFFSPDPGYGTFTVPGIPSVTRVRNGGSLDITFSNEVVEVHDQFYFPETETFEFEIVNVGGGGTMCVALANTVSPDGFEFEEAAGTLNLYQGATNNAATGPCTAGSTTACQSELADDGNRGGPAGWLVGGAPTETLNPPFVDVDAGSIAIVSTACTQPSGSIF